ncbi:Uncharacterised protein [Burkholderia pseudomallei]|nr:Uncharacterised protein [Burkholderia pseudomallei]
MSTILAPHSGAAPTLPLIDSDHRRRGWRGWRGRLIAKAAM